MLVSIAEQSEAQDVRSAKLSPAVSGSPIIFGDCCGTFDAPTQPGAVGVVLCPGLLNDACTAYRSFRLIAAALAAAGYPALRFDYPGTGNAPDTTEPDHLAVWLRSVADAVDWLRDHAGVRDVVLIGFRFGALLAAAAAAGREDIVGLVLLQPFLRGRAFIRQVAIEVSMNQGGERQGAALSLLDLDLGAETQEKISALDLRRVAPAPHCGAAIFAESSSPGLSEVLASWRDSGVRVEQLGFDGLEALMRPAFMCHEPSADVGRIVGCVAALAPQQPVGGLLPVRRDTPILSLSGCVEEPLRFGPDGRLFGILCRPAPPVRMRDQAVILVNSSGNPSHGFARLAVRLARRLASNGVASFRIDFAGLGDSLAEGDAETHCFATDRTDDVRHAVDFLVEQGYGRFAIQGLCSGAYHAFHAALADGRISDLFLLNMPLFQWREGDPVEFLDHAIQSPAQFLPKLFTVDIWKRILSGELGLGERLKMQLIWCYGWAMATVRRAGALVGLDLAPGFPLRSMRTLSARARTFFVQSPGDESVAMLRQTFGDPPRAPGAVFEVMAGADHAFTAPGMQRDLADRILFALGGKISSPPAPEAAEKVTVPG